VTGGKGGTLDPHNVGNSLTPLCLSVCLPRGASGRRPNSTMERPRKPKIGTVEAHTEGVYWNSHAQQPCCSSLTLSPIDSIQVGAGALEFS